MWLLLVFPRAGVLVGGLSGTIQSVAAPVFAVARMGRVEPTATTHRLLKLVIFGIIGLAFYVVLTGANEPPFRYATLGTIVIAPLGFHLAASYTPSQLRTVTITAVLATSLYALLQFQLGPENVALPGLTHVWGENLIGDNPLRSVAGTTKSPSTFQNGNLFATFLCPALGALVVLRRARPSRVINVTILIALAALLVSLARAPVGALLIGLGLVAVSKARPTTRLSPAAVLRTIATITTALGAIALYIIFDLTSTLEQRFISETLSDRTGAGRTGQYVELVEISRSLGIVRTGQLLLVGLPESLYDAGLEGYPRLLTWYGVPALAFILALFRIGMKASKATGVALAGFAAFPLSTIIDNSILYPPSLFNWFFMAGVTAVVAKAIDEQNLDLDVRAPTTNSLQRKVSV